MSATDVKKQTAEIVKKLKKEYPGAGIALNFDSPFELLIATILSAQCTDERVNKVTPELFEKYKTPSDFADAESTELEEAIHSTGFYKQKTKSIKNCCQKLIAEYDGRLPADVERLEKLPGVGRKTASVVAGNAFGIPAVAVDTHVRRLSQRLELTDSDNPDKIEKRLREIVAEKDWIIFSHLLAAHGRKICKARKAMCTECVIGDLCPSYNKV